MRVGVVHYRRVFPHFGLQAACVRNAKEAEQTNANVAALLVPCSLHSALAQQRFGLQTSSLSVGGVSPTTRIGAQHEDGLPENSLINRDRNVIGTAILGVAS